MMHCRPKNPSFILCLASAWCAVAACAGPARADIGAACWSGVIGQYRIAVFQAPAALCVGAGQFSLLAQDTATGQLAPEAGVELRYVPRADPRTPRTVRFQSQATGGELYQTVRVELPDAGWWDFELALCEAAEPTSARFSSYVAAAPPRWQTFWPWLGWPAVAVGLFALHEYLVARDAARRGHRDLAAAR